MKLPIYLDYAATTPADPRVASKMIRDTQKRVSKISRENINIKQDIYRTRCYTPRRFPRSLTSSERYRCIQCSTLPCAQRARPEI